ncbi:Retinoblastoma-binding protein 5 [Trachymyrmex cornetzi]|uniref:Retinoblastoma-binding protein 5 n=1 Tax=Trachymyrmex cornetzi TaxID=471704 RepID=A0A195E3R0_9HYME|nr:Retinoblastoma-binding protein 5 [Trachymyrmex cornetzi]
MEKTKKVDKLPLDPQREFLDMDTDDEDFGRQESPETEEEQSSEPIKPVFDEQDLDKLVQYVKDFTILPYIKDSDWKEDCYTIIREYFEYPAYTLLCIYFQVDTLKAQLTILDDNQSDFIYFLRIPWHVFTVDNFHATVVFGSINRNAMMCVLKVMENMYVSVARNSSEWPEIIRNNLFFNLHNFLMCLTEWVYKPMGLTKLYIPGENLSDIVTLHKDKKSNSSNNETNGLHVSKELQESEKALIDRFEGIVRYWIKQIRQVLTSTSTNNSGRTVFDELQYWTTKYFNLCCLHDQLSNMEIQSMLHLLENKLDNETDLLVYFRNNIEVLCEAISIQIVHQCKNYVNLQVTKITALIKSNSNWDVNEQLIFNYTDTFMQRCYDIIEICNTSTVFEKCTNVGMIGGPNGIKYDACCRQIENLFSEILDEIKLIRYEILDVTKFSWLENMLNFRNFVMELESMIKNLIDCIFDEIKNIEEGIEAIYALQRFKHRESLRDLLSRKWVQEFDGTLDCISLAVTCTFNKRGTLLAVGCNDGRIVIWDFLTRGIAKIISAHVHPVCSLSWSRNGHKLLSASTDNNVCIWDVLSGECDQKYRFPSPILKIQFHPRNLNKFLVCPMRHAAVMVDVEGTHRVIPLDEDSDLNIVASFDRRGDYVYTGNARGRVLVLDAETLNVKASYKITQGTASNTAVKSIEFARRGSCFLVNTADRVIRVYDSTEILACGKDGEPEPIQKLQDLVNKTMWKKCCFSGDGEYVCAGSARQHALYVWEKSIGNLVKILHGTKGELLLDVVWHPVRPIIASISSGVVSIWAQNQVENWSAFAPDFKELDENVEYEERESEFDLSDEDKSVVQGEEAQDEEIEVDVASIDRVAAFCSSDEETEDIGSLQFLPISPDVEDSEDNQVMPHEPPMKKHRSHDIDLQGAPTDETHPLLNKGKDKPTTKKGRPRLEYKKGK